VHFNKILAAPFTFFTNQNHKNLPPPFKVFTIPVILLALFILYSFSYTYHLYQISEPKLIQGDETNTLTQEKINGSETTINGDVKSTDQISSGDSKEQHTSSTIVDEKYLTYLPHGHFHSQRIALENALILAWMLNRTLVMPPILLGVVQQYSPAPVLGNQLQQYNTKKNVTDCAKFKNEKKRAKCLDRVNAYTLYPWDKLMDMKFIKDHVRIVHRPDFILTNLKTQLNIENDKDIYFPDDTSRHYYRIYDTSESEIGLDKYETRLLKSTLEKNDVKLLHFNSLNGKTRLVLEQKNNTEFSRQFYRKFIIDTPEIVIASDRIVTQLGGVGNYIGLNVISEKEYFKSLSGKTGKNITKLVKEEAKQFKPRYESTSTRKKQHATLAGKCRSTSVKSETVVYLATDEEKIHEQFAPLFLNFPCTFTLLNFETRVRELKNLTNLVDGVNLYKFLKPILDLTIAAKGGKFIGSADSAFSIEIKAMINKKLVFSFVIFFTSCNLLVRVSGLQVCSADGAIVAVKPAFNPKEYRKVEDCLSSTGAEIIFPSDSSYEEARLGERIRVQHFPDAVAFPTNSTQIQALVLCANAFQRKPVPRNGGHSYESFSSRNNSIVIDISNMVDVTIDEVAKKATVGAGIRLGPLYLQLGRKNFTFIAGTCPTVGLTGIIAAGGFGPQSRKYGVSGDLALSVQVVTADGSLLIANSSQNSDLFWALRGGGGGSYGIVTQWTLSLIPAWQQNTIFQIKYPIKSAQQGLKLWSSWAPDSPENLTTVLVMSKGDGFTITGHFLGASDQLKTILDASGLRNLDGKPSNEKYKETNHLGVRVYFAGEDDVSKQSVLNIGTSPFTSSSNQLDATVGIISDYPPGPKQRRELEKTKAMFFNESFTLEQTKIIVELVKSCPGDAYAEFDVYGGIFSKQPSNLTAFVHRSNTKIGVQVSVFLTGDTKKDKGLLDWIKSWDIQGYVDADLTNPQEAYFGSNLPQLRIIKAKYDPNNTFLNPQSVLPAVGINASNTCLNNNSENGTPNGTNNNSNSNQTQSTSWTIMILFILTLVMF
ncbi:10434_t:CDS:2, partial [Ambispora gerdemannii]